MPAVSAVVVSELQTAEQQDSTVSTAEDLTMTSADAEVSLFNAKRDDDSESDEESGDASDDAVSTEAVDTKEELVDREASGDADVQERDTSSGSIPWKSASKWKHPVEDGQ